VSAPDLAARANALYTAAIADILDRRGLTSQTLPSELVPLQDFPVFSRFTTPQDSTGRWEIVEHGDVVLEIGGVTVARGDWIVADHDGIVVIPGNVAEDVITAAEEKAATENEIRAAVRAGTTPLDAYERYGTF
jgi:4-hydroxy-4-methyl-2-oxoglutarate aldolase